MSSRAAADCRPVFEAEGLEDHSGGTLVDASTVDAASYHADIAAVPEIDTPEAAAEEVEEYYMLHLGRDSSMGLALTELAVGHRLKM